MPFIVEQPLRIGVVGLGRAGAFHVERLGLRDDVRVTAIHDPDLRRLAAAPLHAGRSCATWSEFLTGRDLDLVIIAAPTAARGPLIWDALRRGCDVAVEPPLYSTAAEADQLLDLARDAGRFLGVVHRARYDDDFRTAFELVGAGGLGRLLSARLTLWACGEPSSAGLVRRMAQRLDQLLQLAGDVPTTLFAVRRADPQRPSIAVAWAVVVTFREGMTAVLDVDAGTSATLRTGWILSGTEGAYQNFQHLCRTADGEIFGVPRPLTPVCGDRFYDDLFAAIREPDPSRRNRSAHEARHVVALLEAMHRSAATGRAVPLVLPVIDLAPGEYTGGTTGAE